MFTTDNLFHPEYILIYFLTIAIITDFSKHLIPNILILMMLISGLSLQMMQSGLGGLGYGIAGIFIGFICFMPFHLAHGMRAGDLKLMAAAGSFLGLNTIIAVGFSLIMGAISGLLVLMWRDGLNAYLSRYTAMFTEFAGTGRFHYTPPEKGEAAASNFPYAVAIAAGCLATLQLSW